MAYYGNTHLKLTGGKFYLWKILATTPKNQVTSLRRLLYPDKYLKKANLCYRHAVTPLRKEQREIDFLRACNAVMLLLTTVKLFALSRLRAPSNSDRPMRKPLQPLVTKKKSHITERLFSRL